MPPDPSEDDPAPRAASSVGGAAPRDPAALALRMSELAAELGEPVTLDGLTRDFRIFQRRRGHRHSTDDLLTAWYAVTHPPSGSVRHILDLGSGIGSVGLSVLWHLREATLTAIEVQEGSFRLLCENIWANDVSARVRAIHGDLRDAVPSGRFDLISGSPPYFDVKNGIVSADPQRAAARFELHGDVRDYCHAASRALAPAGRFAFCFPAAQRARAEAACAAASLRIVATRDVVPKQGLAPLIALFACAAVRDVGPGAVAAPESPLVVRDGQGAHTPEMDAVRRLFGML